MCSRRFNNSAPNIPKNPSNISLQNLRNSQNPPYDKLTPAPTSKLVWDGPTGLESDLGVPAARENYRKVRGTLRNHVFWGNWELQNANSCKSLSGSCSATIVLFWSSACGWCTEWGVKGGEAASSSRSYTSDYTLFSLSVSIS